MDLGHYGLDIWGPETRGPGQQEAERKQREGVTERKAHTGRQYESTEREATDTSDRQIWYLGAYLPPEDSLVAKRP